jgi:conjugal transfer mating pair stabilization protein TraN
MSAPIARPQLPRRLPDQEEGLLLLRVQALRILQEQGRQQLNKPWGKPKTEQCLGFTIDEFARLDLSRMDFSEVYAEFTDAARLPDELQATQDIQQKIEDYYARARQ